MTQRYNDEGHDELNLRELHRSASRPRIVTLCGSTRFYDEFQEANRCLTLEGKIVLTVGVYGHQGDELSEETKESLDKLHKRKIDLADEIFVVNPGGYIGESTRSEIEYAFRQGKPIRYLEEENK